MGASKTGQSYFRIRTVLFWRATRGTDAVGWLPFTPAPSMSAPVAWAARSDRMGKVPRLREGPIRLVAVSRSSATSTTPSSASLAVAVRAAGGGGRWWPGALAPGTGSATVAVAIAGRSVSGGRCARMRRAQWLNGRCHAVPGLTPGATICRPCGTDANDLKQQNRTAQKWDSPVFEELRGDPCGVLLPPQTLPRLRGLR